MGGAWRHVEITTERLTLRRPERPDGPRVAELVGDLAVARNLSRVPHPYGLDDADAFLRSLGDPLALDRPFAITLPGEGLVGMVGFQREPGALWDEIGYWLGRPYWNRGLASEAVRAAVDWAAKDAGRRALASGHFADNAASGRVLEKAGFLYTSEVRQRLSLARGEAVATRMMAWLA